MKFKHILISIIAIALLFSLSNCKKEIIEEDPLDNTGDQLIDSIKISSHSIKAWADTSFITIFTSNENVNVSWEANHGTLMLNGSTTVIIDPATNEQIVEGNNVVYLAGECCLGTNTITYKATEGDKIQSDTIQIFVSTYYEK